MASGGGAAPTARCASAEEDRLFAASADRDHAERRLGQLLELAAFLEGPLRGPLVEPDPEPAQKKKGK